MPLLVRRSLALQRKRSGPIDRERPRGPAPFTPCEKEALHSLTRKERRVAESGALTSLALLASLARAA
jgi:hypothetical protein